MSRSSSTLQSGRDYPGTWEEFLDWFPDEQACLNFLEELRWPDGFLCPNCSDQNEPLRASRNRLICRACKQQCTVTAGTILVKHEPRFVVGLLLCGTSLAKSKASVH